jgi:hypothetical protein
MRFMFSGLRRAEAHRWSTRAGSDSFSYRDASLIMAKAMSERADQQVAAGFMTSCAA